MVAIATTGGEGGRPTRASHDLALEAFNFWFVDVEIDWKGVMRIGAAGGRYQE
jgi:hypothetical protein